MAKYLLLIAMVLTGLVALGLLVNKRERGAAQTEQIGGIEKVTPTEVKEASGSGKLTLLITSPAGGTKVKTSAVTVKGKTLPKAEVAVNETELVADSAGNFATTVQLDEGENYLLVVANDEEGNVVEKELIVTREVSE